MSTAAAATPRIMAVFLPRVGGRVTPPIVCAYCVGAEANTASWGGGCAGAPTDGAVSAMRVGSRSTPGNAGRDIGAVIASCAALANSVVVRYRWLGSLAMPVAITRSNADGTSGLVFDGRGGGGIRCAVTWRSTVSPGNGRS